VSAAVLPRTSSWPAGSVGATLHGAIARLADAGVPEPRADAEVLMAHVLGADRARTIAAAGRPLPDDAAARLEALLVRRERREPVAYLVGEREFWSMALAVDARVLVPRPETELLVEVACRMAPEARRVLDAGTGSGAIAAALATELPNATVIATDRDRRSLAVASANLARHAPRVARVAADWLSAFAADGFDLVVSNPPYLRDDEMETLQPEVGRFEPRGALVAGPDGLDALAALVRQAPAVLAQGGWLVMEMGQGQAAALSAVVERNGRYETPLVVRDAAGIERVMAVRIGEGGAWTSS